MLSLLGMDMRGFQVKRGAVFRKGARRSRVDFSEASDVRFPNAHQVQRQAFDARVRRTMEAAGVRRLHAKAVRA